MSMRATRNAVELLRSTSEVGSIAYDLTTVALAEIAAIERIPAILADMARTDWRDLPPSNEALAYFLIREMELRIAATLEEK